MCFEPTLILPKFLLVNHKLGDDNSKNESKRENQTEYVPRIDVIDVKDLETGREAQIEQVEKHQG